MTAMIVPATESCWLLTYGNYYPDKAAPEFGKWPVIAWAINTDAVEGIVVTPISSNGEEPASGHAWAILQPDGSVTSKRIGRRLWLHFCLV